MSKKSRRKKGGQYSSLEQHRLQQKVLKPPFRTIGNVKLHSWINDRLPEVLWALLLANALPRDRYLDLFRAISDTAAKFVDTDVFLTHSELAKISDADFVVIMERVIQDDVARNALAPLRLFAGMP